MFEHVVHVKHVQHIATCIEISTEQFIKFYSNFAVLLL